MSWEGFGVSVRCGALGCYQGTIAAADGDSITLTKPFRNGFPYPKAQVTLKASDIKSLEIISERVEAAPAHSTVVAGGRRRGARSVGESLQPPQPAPANANPSGSASGGTGKARSKPIDIQGARPARHNQPHSGSGGVAGSGGGAGGAAGAGGAGSAARRRNEACFGAGALDHLAQDFDFEGNLALFDKEALRQQMRPDVVRVAEEAAAHGRLRPDQSVLPAPPAPAPVHVPLELRGPVWYVTDGGARVPSLSARARRAAWRALRDADPPGIAARVLLARATADAALRLLGGGRRLEPTNAHQRPVAAAAARAGPAAAAAVDAARLLQSHGVETYVVAPAATCARVAAALAAYAAGGGRVLRAPGPGGERPRADLLLLALHDPEEDDELDAYGEEIIEWALSMRSTLLLLEPGAGGSWARVGEAARASVVALLPGAGAGGRLLLANVAPPPAALAALGLRYRPPFGAAALLPLHPVD